MLSRSQLARLARISTDATAALRESGGGAVQIRINDAVAAGRLGAQYKRRAEAWFPEARADLLERMRDNVPQPDVDWGAYDAALETWEEAGENGEKPDPKDFETLKPLEFGFGDFGSVWFDVDLTGTVDGLPVTKKTRVTLASNARPYEVVLDATFDETF